MQSFVRNMGSIPRRGLRSIFDADARLHVIVSDVIDVHDGASPQRQEQYSRQYRTVVFAHESDKEQNAMVKPDVGSIRPDE